MRDGGAGVGDERATTRSTASPCAANRWLLDRRAARRVGIRRHGRVRLLRHRPARRLPPRRRVAGATRRRPRCTPGIDVELPGHRLLRRRRCATRSTPAPSRWPTSTWRSAVRSASKFRLGLFEQPVRRRRRGAASHTRTADADRARPRRRRATAWCCCATTACCRCAAPRSVAVIGPNAASAAQHARRLQLPRPRRVAARSAEERPQRVRHAARPRRRRRRRQTTSSHVGTCSTSCGARCPRPTSATSRGARSTTTTDRGSTTPVAAAAASDVAVLVMGERVRADRRLHDRREPRRRLARSARGAGGTRAGRRRHRHAGGARARRRPPDRLASGPRRGRRGR